MTNKFFIMDLQDTTNNWETTLEGVRQYIIDSWIDNDTDNEEFETEEDWDAFTTMVQAGDLEQLDSCLQGIGYTLFDSEKDMNEFIEKVGE